MSDHVHEVLAIAKAIQADVPRRGRPPDEGTLPDSDQVVPHSVLRGTRGYIESVVYQVNGAYERGWFDACAVMIRRLIETLIIESFEHYTIADRIKTGRGDFLQLGDLVDRTLSEPAWNLSRNTKRALPRLKDVGDKSAHSRRYIAHRVDIERLIPDIRVTVQELAYLAGLKS